MRVASPLVLNPLACARDTHVVAGENFLSHIGRPSTTVQILKVIHFFLFSEMLGGSGGGLASPASIRRRIASPRLRMRFEKAQSSSALTSLGVIIVVMRSVFSSSVMHA